MLLSDVLVTLATQQHLEYHCKAPFQTPCIKDTIWDGWFVRAIRESMALKTDLDVSFIYVSD
jgi:hypothetical protein